MTEAKPTATATLNREGFTKQQYVGAPSTLCPGCGHDNITRNIISAYWEYGINPFDVAKTSGIGCSSKTPAYFMPQAQGFNSVHGRMPSISTGAKLANTNLQLIGVSGDGDTASIGLGQFCHLIRRNLRMVYVIEDNGVYGLTKGQFSATADFGTKLKGGEVNYFQNIDPCALAIELGCGYVARSYSSDFAQVDPLIKGAIAHNGLAVLDIISPCVTFNNHEGSTKSYDAVKEHDVPLHDIDFIPFFEQKAVDYKPGETIEVELPDGSHIYLKKLGNDHNPTDKLAALNVLEKSKQEKKLVTGLIYIDPKSKAFNDMLNLPEKPLHSYGEKELRPSKEKFAELLKRYA